MGQPTPTLCQQMVSPSCLPPRASPSSPSTMSSSRPQRPPCRRRRQRHGRSPSPRATPPPTPNPKHSSSPPTASATQTRSASPRPPADASADCGAVARRLAMPRNRLQSARRPVSPRRSSRPCPTLVGPPTRPRATHPLRPFLRRAVRVLLSSAHPLCRVTTPPPRSRPLIRTACSSPCRSYAPATTPCLRDPRSKNLVTCHPWTAVMKTL